MKKRVLLSILGFLIFTCILADAFALQTSNAIQATGVIKYRPILVVAKDGSGDFTNIRSALNAWSEDALIYVKAGLYEENALDIPSECHITGEQGTQVINNDDTIDTFSAQGTLNNWLSNILIENLYIKGGRNAILFSRVEDSEIINVEVDSSNTGILADRSNNTLISDCHVHDSKEGFGIVITGSYNEIRNCSVERTYKHSNILITTSPDRDSVGNKIIDTYVREAGYETGWAGANGIYLGDDWDGVVNTGTQVIRCTTEYNSGSGFKLNPAQDVTFEDCVSRQDNWGWTIMTQGTQSPTKNVFLKNCESSYTVKTDGFNMYTENVVNSSETYVSDITFENCRANNNKDDGWWINVGKVTLIEPKATGNPEYGIMFDSKSHDCVVRYYRHDLSGNGVGEVLNRGTNIEITVLG